MLFFLDATPAPSELQISVLHGDQVPAGMAVQEIGTQMAPLREVISGHGLPHGHLLGGPVLCQPREARQHGTHSEEEAFGLLPVRDSYCLYARHTPGTKDSGCVVWILHCHPSSVLMKL